MNKNQVKGSAKELGGKARQAAGKTIGNKEMERKGKTKELAGKTQKALGDAQATIKRHSS